MVAFTSNVFVCFAVASASSLIRRDVPDGTLSPNAIKKIERQAQWAERIERHESKGGKDVSSAALNSSAGAGQPCCKSGNPGAYPCPDGDAACRTKLRQAAKGDGKKDTTGPMCHDTVLGWLEKAGYIPADAHIRLFANRGDGASRTDVFKAILVSRSDTQVTSYQQLEGLPEGQIIGFYARGQDVYQHTIVAVGAALFAGSNNGGIINPNENIPRAQVDDYMLMQSKQIAFGDDGWGTGHYDMFATTPDIVRGRVETQLR